MDYAEAVNRLNDEISTALARGERAGLTDKEVIAELRRMADELEAESRRNDRHQIPRHAKPPQTLATRRGATFQGERAHV